eukprot:767821-Hanusia_phi.AAC.5
MVHVFEKYGRTVKIDLESSESLVQNALMQYVQMFQDSCCRVKNIRNRERSWESDRRETSASERQVVEDGNPLEVKQEKFSTSRIETFKSMFLAFFLVHLTFVTSGGHDEKIEEQERTFRYTKCNKSLSGRYLVIPGSLQELSRREKLWDRVREASGLLVSNKKRSFLHADIPLNGVENILREYLDREEADDVKYEEKGVYRLEKQALAVLKQGFKRGIAELGAGLRCPRSRQEDRQTLTGSTQEKFSSCCVTFHDSTLTSEDANSRSDDDSSLLQSIMVSPFLPLIVFPFHCMSRRKWSFRASTHRILTCAPGACTPEMPTFSAREPTIKRGDSLHGLPLPPPA